MSVSIGRKRIITRNTWGVLFAVVAIVLQPLLAIAPDVGAVSRVSVAISPTSHVLVAGGEGKSTVDLTGYHNAKLTFDYKIGNLEAEDTLEYGIDGQGTLGVLQGTTGNPGTGEEGSVAKEVTSTGLTSLFFRNTGETDGTYDQITIENISVTAEKTLLHSVSKSASLVVTPASCGVRDNIAQYAGDVDNNFRFVVNLGGTKQAVLAEYIPKGGSFSVEQALAQYNTVTGNSLTLPYGTFSVQTYYFDKDKSYDPSLYDNYDGNHVRYIPVGAPYDITLRHLTDADCDVAPAKVTGMHILQNGVNLGTHAYVNDRRITVAWDANTEADFDFYRYQADSNRGSDGKIDFTTTLRQHSRSGTIRNIDGTYSYRVQAVDKAGNAGEWSDWVSATLDRVAPNVKLIAPTEQTINGVATISGIADPDIDHYYLVIKNSDGKVVAGPRTVYKTAIQDYSFDTTAVPDGKYTIHLAVRDKAGNRDNRVSLAVKSVTIDNTAPQLKIITPEEVVFIEGDNSQFGAVVYGTYEGDLTKIEATVEGAGSPTVELHEFEDGAWAVGLVDLNAEAIYTVTVRALDALGNVSEVKRLVFTAPSNTTPITEDDTTTTTDPVTTEQPTTPRNDSSAITDTPIVVAAPLAQQVQTVVASNATSAEIAVEPEDTTNTETNKPSVLSSENTTKNAPLITEKTEGGRCYMILWLCWWWWIVIAVIVAMILWIIGALRRRSSDDSMPNRRK